jgi:predicted phosphodiesterase
MKAIYILGDTHGNWKPMKYKIKTFDIRDCIIIHVGDIGLGFQNYDQQEYELMNINEFFKERNIEFLGIRGNHDDPYYFDGGYDFSNMEFLRDYTVKKIGGKTFQFVGGAISVDRKQRTRDISWWKDEVFDFNPDKLVKCDVLVTHSAPLWNGPVDRDPISSWCDDDKTLWAELKMERLAHNRAIFHCEPSRHYCGHFHVSSTAERDGCISRILDINELLEITNY